MSDLPTEIASKLLFENDRVRVWEARLAPGEEYPTHRHPHDYVQIIITGDRIGGRIDPSSDGVWSGEDWVETDVHNGMTIWAEQGSAHNTVNTGEEPFYEILVELTGQSGSSAEVPPSDLPTDIATKVLFENDRVRVWEARLEPGEEFQAHMHAYDYVQVMIEGDKVAAHIDPASAGTWEGHDYVEAEVHNGLTIWAERGSAHRMVNVGDQPFYEILVELKD